MSKDHRVDMEAAREAEATVVTATAEMEEEDASAASPTSSSPSFLKNKVCAVCSDRALGYNFNALTCESCKAFFRRNALKNKEFKCPFSDKCEVTVVTRRFCQKCRLKKCFDVGMKKEWILSEEEKQQKRQKIEENRAKKRADRRRSSADPAPAPAPATPFADSSSPEPTQGSPAATATTAATVATAVSFSTPSSTSIPGGAGRSESAASPFTPSEAITGERPQARVLPSARAASADAEIKPRKSKVMRMSSQSALDTTSFPGPSSEGPSSTTGPFVPSVPVSDHEHTASSGQFALIKQELAGEKVKGQSGGNGAGVRLQEFQERQESSFPPAPPAGTAPISAPTLPATGAPPPPPPPSVESVMLQPLVNAAAAMMATAPIMEGQGNSGGHHDQHQLMGIQNMLLPSTPVPPAAAQHPDTPSGAIPTAALVNSCEQPPPPATTTSGPSSMIIPDFSHTSNFDDIVAVAIEAEFHVESISVEPQNNGPPLNDPEKDRLHELYVASRALVEPIDAEKNAWNTEPNNLISVINLTDLAIKRIIRMTKKIAPFISMCQEDQIALLKGGCTELMILRSVINYNPDKNTWRLPSKDSSKELSMELLKEASQLGVNLYEEHQRFVKSFDPRWRTDENVMLLLSAIALFNPSRSNVTHKEVIRLEQDTYYQLLRRYLETVCATGCDARMAYLHLIGRLQDLHRLNESHIQLFLEVNPKLVEPLLIEIFDLKPYSK